VHTARFSPDGKRVVTASEDWTARLWDAATGQPLGSPFVHTASVRDAEFSPDGSWVATASERSAWIWPVARPCLVAPEWLPELAEAVGGLRQAAELSTESVPPAKLLELQHRLGTIGSAPGNAG
jgi:WD40 repeat protein